MLYNVKQIDPLETYINIKMLNQLYKSKIINLNNIL